MKNKLMTRVRDLDIFEKSRKIGISVGKIGKNHEKFMDLYKEVICTRKKIRNLRLMKKIKSL